MWRQFRRFLYHQYDKLVLFYFTVIMEGVIRRRHRKYFDQVRVFLMFMGYPRSGHTLIGALLNAHPEAVVAHELNVLRYVRKGFSRDRLYARLIGRDRWFAARGYVWTGYSYRVPDQWQGKYARLRVIGDKRGGRTSRELAWNPELPAKLKETTGVKLKIIHIVRNPFDNIATRARGGNYYNRAVTPEKLHTEIERHFKEVAAIEKIRREQRYEIFELSHEAFLDDPRRHLADMCRFLEIEPYGDYIEDCMRIIRKSKHKSRNKIAWDEEAIDAIYYKMKEYEFLQGYHFNE